MKKRGGLVLLLLVSVLFATCLPVFAETANLTISATIVTPIQISLLNGLDFGRLFKGAVALTVDPATPVAGTTPATFQVNGEPNTAFQVTLPVNTTISDGATTLGVSAFTSTLAGGAGVLDATGLATFKVGATLDSVPITATSGTYTGSTTITVVYTF